MAQVVRKIKLREQRESEAQRIADSFSLGSVASRVIAARGYQANDNLKLFLSPSLKEGLPSPKNLKNLEAAQTYQRAC